MRVYWIAGGGEEGGCGNGGDDCAKTVSVTLAMEVVATAGVTSTTMIVTSTTPQRNQASGDVAGDVPRGLLDALKCGRPMHVVEHARSFKLIREKGRYRHKKGLA